MERIIFYRKNGSVVLSMNISAVLTDDENNCIIQLLSDKEITNAKIC